jgi:hypothetical protein
MCLSAPQIAQVQSSPDGVARQALSLIHHLQVTMGCRRHAAICGSTWSSGASTTPQRPSPSPFRPPPLTTKDASTLEPPQPPPPASAAPGLASSPPSSSPTILPLTRLSKIQTPFVPSYALVCIGWPQRRPDGTPPRVGQLLPAAGEQGDPRGLPAGQPGTHVPNGPHGQLPLRRVRPGWLVRPGLSHRHPVRPNPRRFVPPHAPPPFPVIRPGVGETRLCGWGFGGGMRKWMGFVSIRPN